MEKAAIEGNAFKAIGCGLVSLEDSFVELGIPTAAPPAEGGEVDAGESSVPAWRNVTEAMLSFNALTDDALAPLATFADTLQTLILDNNELVNLTDFPVLPSLHTLWLNNNNLSTLESVLQSLKHSCPNLRYLSLLRNPCCPSELNGKLANEYRRYRLYTKYCLPSLTLLDSAAYTPEEAEEAATKGKFYKTITAAAPTTAPKPSVAPPQARSEGDKATATTTEAKGAQKGGDDEEDKEEEDADDLFSKLEKTKKTDVTYFVQQRHFYNGTTSEGNRFIRDDVL